MSSGQKPRRPEFYPRMKVRGRGRRRLPPVVVLWAVGPSGWTPIGVVGGWCVPLDPMIFDLAAWDGGDGR